MNLGFFFHIAFLLPLLCILAILSLFIGVSDIHIFDILQGHSLENEVFLISRIPRTITIIITGMSLSICGLIMQQLTQNKFVSPTTAGTMDCAKLGILVSMIFFAQSAFITQVFIASLFALAGSLIFLQILNKIKLKNLILVPLIGLMFGGVINSITTFFAYQMNLIQNMQGWLQGDFSNTMQGSYELIYLTLPLLLLAFLYANKITIAGMGKDIATNLGLSYQFILNLGLIIVSIIVSVIILIAGVIPFLGLIVPNIVSIFKGDDLRGSILIVGLFGAVLMLVCDIFSRLIIYPFEVPISLTLGVLGSFMFALILLKKKNYA
ncbi:ABC transporter permease [Campylobacter sp. MIT 19-121]|uniref:ABC transporter permease n=1 Tax=Campylobacter sp. MIT 19-121 TaxID=2703906 RepID=UPI00192F0FC0|nr:iron chelate uptake ABC transporter family permease subunit [Campylobacter sp. MIT 19-121]